MRVEPAAEPGRDPVLSGDVTRRPIAALGLLTITAYGTWFYGFGVLFDDMRADLDTTDRTLAAAFALAQLLAGVFGVAAGHVLDRSGARPVFVVGAVFGAGLSASSAAVERPLLFAALYGVGGGIIGACGFYGVTQTVAARLQAGSETRSIARLTIWGAFSSPILIPLTEVARRTVGWRATIVLASACVAVSFAIAAVIVRPADVDATHAPLSSALRRLVTQPAARRLTLSASLSSASVAVLLVYQVPVMTSLGVTATLAASIAAARGLAQLLGRLPLTWFIGVVGERRAVQTARLGVAVGSVVLLAIAVPGVPILYVVIIGTAVGALSPLDGIFARLVLGGTGLGTMMGVLALASGISGAVGPLVAATLIDATGWRPTAAVLAAVLAVAATVVTPRSPSR